MRCSVFIIAAFTLRALAIVRSPPRISKQPPNGEFPFEVANNQSPKEKDKPILIECEAEGEPAPMYRWTKNGVNFNWTEYADRIVQQRPSGTLHVSHPSEEDAGWYQCFATNEWGTATSNKVFLRKNDSLSFLSDSLLIPLNATEGEPFKIPCRAPDVWPKPKVYWLRNRFTDGSSETINNSRMTVDPEGNLWFSNVTRNDASDDFYYVCAAKSFNMSEYQLGERYLLRVIPSNSSANKYNLTKQYVSGPNVIALKGETIELYCIYGGTPLPETGWLKCDAPLKPNDRVTRGNNGKSLIIKTVNFDDAESYFCYVWNGVGPWKSEWIKLMVEDAPYFTIEPEIINAAENETVEFRCEADGVPVPRINWTRNGIPINEFLSDSRRNISTNSIVIENLTKNDTANYGCNATNSHGYVYKDVYVNVLGPEEIIIRPPTNLTTVEGKNVSFTCRAVDLPKSNISWMRNGQELTGDRYTTSENGDLEINNVNLSDIGTYTCHASNKFGEKEANASLIFEVGNSQQEIETRNFATAGWFMGMMLAVAFLLFLFIIDCVMKHFYRGTHPIHKREHAAGYPNDEVDLCEDSPPWNLKPAGGRDYMARLSHKDGKRPEFKTDPMAKYGVRNMPPIFEYPANNISRV